MEISPKIRLTGTRNAEIYEQIEEAIHKAAKESLWEHKYEK